MHDTGGLIVDGLLVAGFGAQHSALAAVRAKARARSRFGIEPVEWRSVESVCNVVYVLLAAALWQHVHQLVWDVHGPTAGLMWALAAVSWLWYWQLHLFEYDCGLAFGSTALVSHLAGQAVPRLVPWKVGTRRWIRFPVHTAFFGMFFFLPHMTADLFVLAVVLNVYNVIGSVLYDQRLRRLSGRPYVEYQAVTGLIWPPVYRSPRGAADLDMAKPVHWRRPLAHLPGLVGGVLLAGLYLLVLGRPHMDPLGALLTGVTGLVGAAVVGAALGRVGRSDAADWDQRQSDLSTTVAVSAASGIVLWTGSIWLWRGHPAPFAYYLSLWFTVQYLGHVAAFLANRRYWGADQPRGATVADPTAEPAVLPQPTTTSVMA
ncbi:MAG: hypothetical protein JO337_01945 [Acidimicrobiales bacterium]|nr:hypothetical protein [Acidimicrobiales bacterium]